MERRIPTSNVAYLALGRNHRSAQGPNLVSGRIFARAAWESLL
jgi:hypothetical protein